MANFHFSWLMLLSNVTNRKSFQKFKMLINYTLVKYDKCHQTNAIHRIFTIKIWICIICIPPHHNRFTALFRDHPGEPVQEEDFWTSWCKGKLTEADTPTIRLGATPSGLTSAHLHHPPIFFYKAGCPSCHPANNWRQHIIHIRNSKNTNHFNDHLVAVNNSDWPQLPSIQQRNWHKHCVDTLGTANVH